MANTNTSTKTVAKAATALAVSIMTLIGALALQAVSAQAAASETVLYSGTWTKKSFSAAGAWTIFEEDGSVFVRLSDDFKTRKAPDLKIFLSPLPASETSGANATDGSFLVAELTSNRGGQTYALPEGFATDNYQSILIHCEAFSKLWSAADLR